jgi:hypothetical protein
MHSNRSNEESDKDAAKGLEGFFCRKVLDLELVVCADHNKSKRVSRKSKGKDGRTRVKDETRTNVQIKLEQTVKKINKSNLCGGFDLISVGREEEDLMDL